jgi:CPA2 family monovalent cation:H+ antiporter-2
MPVKFSIIASVQYIPNLLSDLALILCSAGIASVLFKKLKQPVVLGYILVGLLVGPNLNFFPTVTEIESIKIWAEIGVIFLLFNLGLEFSFKKLMRLGSAAVITGLFEITMMLLTGYYVGKLLGWKQIDSLFLGGILAISSTTIIFRAFDELNLKPKKFAGIVIGVLIIEDVVAVVLMVLLSTVAVSKNVEGADLGFAVLKLLFFLILWFLAGIFILPSLLKKATKWLNDEMILIISLGLCFAMVLLAAQVGFSPALGAFIMGSLLAETSQAERIEHVLKPVKDLFGAIFFVSVGMLINPTLLAQYAWPVLVITLVVIIGNTLYVSTGALLSGQPIKQSLQVGTSMSQIGEFSFIIATLGLTLGVTSDFLYPVAVGVSVITTFTTPYMMKLADPLHLAVERIIPHKTLIALNRYSTGAERIKGENHWKNVLQSYAEIVVVNVVIIFAIILAFKTIVEPIFWISGSVWSNIAITILALVCMSPFLWMLVTRKINKPSYTQLWINKFNRGPIIVLEISRLVIGVILIAILFNQFFSSITAIGLALIIMLISSIIFSRKLHTFSLRIEERFISNFNLRENMLPQNKVSNLVPWDTHVAIFDVDSDSTLVGRSLLELKLRERFGINIAMIERGERHIMLPDKDAMLYPFDRISVIGTDEQVLEFKHEIEKENKPNLQPNFDAEISLVQVVVKPGFTYLGKTIRQSDIRDQIKGLIVGIERDGERIINPDSNTIFMINDTIWIVGNRKRVKAFFK